jgi:glycosyltransferase involved in cell wall biosynthesis
MEKISIIIVNKNDSRFLIHLISEFKKQGADDIIVVDDNSTDDSYYLAKESGADKVIKKTGNPGPFSSFIEGIKEAKHINVSCWSSDDLPINGYMNKMQELTKKHPCKDLYTCNAIVEREGKHYQRTLFPFTSYVSPDYMVKIFKNGHAKSLNLIGSVMKRDLPLFCWENGGKHLPLNFDGMFFFYGAFNRGIINHGEHLVMYRSYPNSFGAVVDPQKTQDAINIIEGFYCKYPHIAERAHESGIFSQKAQFLSSFALKNIMKLPKFMREMFYEWFYSYDWRIEKL